MKNWPDFNDEGDLPPGIQQATLAEVIDHFGKDTPQRRIIPDDWSTSTPWRFERATWLASSIFGSFVTAKPDPGDIDIFLLMEDSFDAGQLSGETALIFDHLAAQNYEGASIFWIRRLAALEGAQATVEYWQLKRDGTKRGIVEVIEND